VEGDPSSGWRHVDSLEKLLSNAYEGCETLGEIWDRTVSEFEEEPCMGARQLLKGEEIQKNGKTFMQLTFGSYIFDTFSEVNPLFIYMIYKHCFRSMTEFRV
jgi:hypothetical protein